jgi:hypothetical protein
MQVDRPAPVACGRLVQFPLALIGIENVIQRGTPIGAPPGAVRLR